MKKLIFIYLFFAFYSLNTFSMELIKVDKNIYMVEGTTGLPSPENKGFISNSYAVLTEKGWFVIDALSTPELSEEFVKQLQKVSKKPVKYIVVTHYHQDHWFGIKTYKNIGSTIIAHKNLKSFYKSGNAEMMLEISNKNFGNIYKNVKLYPLDIVIENKSDIKFGGFTFKIYSMTPAHTNSDIVVHIPELKVLFVGDLVFYKRIPFAGDSNASSKNWLKVLKQLKKFNAKLIFAGHNKPLNKESISFTENYLKFLREKISYYLDEGLEYDQIKEKLKDTPYKVYPMYDVFHFKNIYKIYNEIEFEDFE